MLSMCVHEKFQLLENIGGFNEIYSTESKVKKKKTTIIIIIKLN